MTRTKRGSNGDAGKASSETKDRKAAARKKREEEARTLALAIAEGGLDKKALNVEIIDVRGKVDYTDFVVVMSGSSDRQVAAIAKGIEKKVHEAGLGHCYGAEGLPQGQWVLMDFGDAIAHIFHKDMRGYYDLESLWIDAARVNVPV